MNKKRRLKQIEKEYKKIWEKHPKGHGIDGKRITELWEEYKGLVFAL